MKRIKYIVGIVIIFVAVAVSLSGAVTIFENIVKPNFAGIIGGILTIVICLYIGRTGFRIFRQEKFRLSSANQKEADSQ